MVDKQNIILKYFREGHSLRKISRDLGINRKTVKKYIEDYQESKTELDNQGVHAPVELKEDLTSPPSYDSSKRSSRVLTNNIQEVIDGLLRQNQQRRDTGLHKQVMKKIDILETLQEQGHKIGYTTICNYIRSKENSQKEAYIKQTYSPADQCEFDWAEVKLNINGKLTKLQLAVFTSCYSNYRLGMLFHRQDTFSFWQAHVDFFKYIGGIYHCMVYDNMRVVIAKFVGKNGKKPTEALLQLSLYYGFGYRFCNVRKGNEKGHVERSVEYVRRKAFSCRIDFDNIEEANKHLLSICDKLNEQPLKENKTELISELLKKETPLLYNYPAADFECGINRILKVDKYSTVSYLTNRYSVPEEYAGKVIDVRIYAREIKFFAFDQKVCEHQRSYGKHTWNIHLSHYLQTLYKKPGALAGSLALDKASQLTKHIYNQYFNDQPKSFVELLLFARRQNISLVTIHGSILKLRDISPGEISLDKIKVLCEKTPTEDSVAAMGPEDQITDKCNVQLKELTDLFFN